MNAGTHNGGVRTGVALAICFVPLLIVLALWYTYITKTQNGTTRGSIEVDERTRTYLLHVPSAYKSARAIPLVIVLHGALQSPEWVERMSKMSVLADERIFLAVYPSGTGRFARVPTWNSGNCCGYALENSVDDVVFIRKLIEQLEREYAVDQNRIFVTGLSNGAMMSYRIACELSDKVAAVEGAQNVYCQPSNPVSVIIFHGTADHVVPFDGGSTIFQLGPKRIDSPVVAAAAFWVREDGCLHSIEQNETAGLKTTIYSNCNAGTGVAVYAIEGGRHTWPGTLLSGSHVEATNLMWAFFMEHPKMPSTPR